VLKGGLIIMKYKKILATIGSFALVGATVAGAFAAAYPANMNADNTVVVQGTGAGAEDSVALNLIDSDLAGPATSGAVVIGSESVKVAAPGNDLSFGEAFSDVRERFTKSHLPTLLADGRIRDDSGAVDYLQRLYPSNHNVTFGPLADPEDYVVNTALANDLVPVLHVDQTEGAAWTLEVDFDSAVDFTDIRSGETLNIAGREFTVEPELSDGDSLVLFASSETVTTAVGESSIVSMDGESYTIEVVGANTDADPGTATIRINGQQFQVSEGDTEWVGDQKFYINRVFMQTIPTATASVEIFAGADEIELEQTGMNPVILNGDILDGVYAEIMGADLSAVTRIDFEFRPGEYASAQDNNEASYLELGEAVFDPLFGTIGLVFESSSLDLKDSSKEVVELRRSARDLDLTFVNREGNSYTIKPVRVDGDDLEFKSTTSDRFYANNTAPLQRNDAVILQEGTSGSEITRVARMITSSPTTRDEIEFRDLSTGETTKVEHGDRLWTTTPGPGAIVARGNLTTNGTHFDWDADNSAAADGWYLFAGSIPADGADYEVSDLYQISTLYTRNNAEIEFEYEITGDSWIVNVTEDEGEGNEFSINVTANGADNNEFNINLAEGNALGGDDDEGEWSYWLSTFGTYVEADIDDNDRVTLWIPADEVTYDVYFTSDVSTTPGEAGSLIVTDTEAATITDKNLIVVGGSAINSIAASLLDVSYPSAGEAFTDATGVGAGQYLVQSFAHEGNVAVLVAGYNQADTENAANYLVNQRPNIAAGQKYVGSTATQASSVVN
jgi:hypothetical protein